MAPDEQLTATAPGSCRHCGTQLAPTLLSCPACRSLVHGDKLKQLQADAEQAAAAGDLTGAVTHWRAALDLLPEGSGQHATIEKRVAALGREIDGAAGSPVGPAAAEREPWFRRGWPLVAAGGIFLLTKGKLLLVGLTKWQTLFSMLLFIGVYLQVWGWKFAVGFVIGIYIHEMGHVAALRRYGVAASAPMFIPGLGAFVRLRQHITDVRQDARVGLAGPIWGLGAGLVAYLVGAASGSQIWLAIAQSTAFINLFNLVPFWQLDGGRGFHALTRQQRLIAALVIGGTWMFSQQGILILLLILAVVQLFTEGAAEPDNGALFTYAGLVVVLAWLSGIQVITAR